MAGGMQQQQQQQPATIMGGYMWGLQSSLVAARLVELVEGGIEAHHQDLILHHIVVRRLLPQLLPQFLGLYFFGGRFCRFCFWFCRFCFWFCCCFRSSWLLHTDRINLAHFATVTSGMDQADYR